MLISCFLPARVGLYRIEDQGRLEMADPAPVQIPCGLLRLPYEIRAQIYELVFQSEGLAPPCPAAVDLSNCKREELYMIGVYYPKSFHHTSLALLRTSRQLHHEVQDLLSRRSSIERPTCKLDVMVTEALGIGRGRSVWPTWITPPDPRFSGEYDLEVDLRLFDIKTSNPLFMANAWPGIISQPLMVILNRLLFYGPQFLQPDPRFPGLQIHTLTMRMHHCASNSVGPYYAYYRGSRTRGTMFSSIHWFMQALEDHGVLVGKVKEMRLLSEEIGESETIPIKAKEGNGKVPADWERCGYGWGPDPNSYYRSSDLAYRSLGQASTNLIKE